MDLLRIHFFFHPPRVLKDIQFILIRLWSNEWFVQFHFEILDSSSFAMPKNLLRLETNHVWLFIIFVRKNQLRPESVETYCFEYTFWPNNLEWTGICEHVPQIWSSTTNRYICYSLGISTSVFIPVKSKFLFVQVIRFHIKYPMQYNNNSPNGIYKKWKVLVLYLSWWNI